MVERDRGQLSGGVQSHTPHRLGFSVHNAIPAQEEPVGDIQEGFQVCRQSAKQSATFSCEGLTNSKGFQTMQEPWKTFRVQHIKVLVLAFSLIPRPERHPCYLSKWFTEQRKHTTRNRRAHSENRWARTCILVWTVATLPAVKLGRRTRLTRCERHFPHWLMLLQKANHCVSVLVHPAAKGEELRWCLCLTLKSWCLKAVARACWSRSRNTSPYTSFR